MQEEVVSGKKHFENIIHIVTIFENVPFNWSISSSSYAFFGFLYFKQLKINTIRQQCRIMHNSPLQSHTLNVFQKSVPTFPPNIPLSILINKGRLKINVKPER